MKKVNCKTEKAVKERYNKVTSFKMSYYVIFRDCNKKYIVLMLDFPIWPAFFR
jgi:hypothetical protein